MANKYNFNVDSQTYEELEKNNKKLSEEIKALEEKQKKYEKEKERIEKANKKMANGETPLVLDATEFQALTDAEVKALEAKKSTLEANKAAMKRLDAGLKAQRNETIKDNLKNLGANIKSAVVQGVHDLRNIGKPVKIATEEDEEAVKDALNKTAAYGLYVQLSGMDSHSLKELVYSTKDNSVYNKVLEFKGIIDNFIENSGKVRKSGKSIEFQQGLDNLLRSLKNMKSEKFTNELGTEVEGLDIAKVKSSKLLKCTQILSKVVTKVTEVSLLAPHKKVLIEIFKTNLYEKVADYIAYRDALTKEGKMAPVRDAAVKVYDAKTLLKEAGVSKVYDKLKKDITEMPKKVKALEAKITKASNNKKLKKDAQDKLIAEVKALGEERMSIIAMAQNFVEHEGLFEKLGEIGFDNNKQPTDAYQKLGDEINELVESSKLEAMDATIKELENKANDLQVVAD